MSAIWGIVDLLPGQTDGERKNRGGRLREEAVRMKKAYGTSRLDNICEKLGDDYYLACGVQYVTREAEKERFPYGEDDGDSGRLFVGDVILDNREPMRQRYPGQPEKREPPDGEILYECFRRDPEGTLEMALGAYACAYLERERHRLTLFCDAVGNRSVYYCYRREEGIFYFSTLLTGITGERERWECNEDWFDRFFKIKDLRAVSEPRETPYRGILRLEPGEILTVTEDGLQRRSYWDPFADRRILTGKSDPEYREMVTEVWKCCVEDVIRGDKETGILLSGGLDSNAVAACAAPYLADRGRMLYSFTSVPEAEERKRRPGEYAVEDERSFVELVHDFQGNLLPEYIVTGKGDLLEENRRLRELLEVPYKAVLNLPWMYESYERAAERGCGILLSGQYGNITISYGDFRCLFLTLLHRGRFRTLTQEICAYSKKYKRSRRWIWKDLLTAGTGQDFTAVSRYMYDKNALRQIGEYEVKLSLATGVVPRDPTRDRRLIELVLNLPVEQFTHAGQERRLVRQYMKGKIPEEILSDEFHKGRQAVGSAELLERQWEEICGRLPGIRKEASQNEKLSREEMVRRFYCGLAREYRRRFEV